MGWFAAEGELARGAVSSSKLMRIYQDGTFSLSSTSMFGADCARERLLGFTSDVDSMRRKSVTGRGAAFLMTGGYSIFASNNRGVVYVTVIGEESGVRTFTTRNPSGLQLSGIRTLSAAAETLLDVAGSEKQTGTVSDVTQLQQLAQLYETGALSESEFQVAKKRLLG